MLLPRTARLAAWLGVTFFSAVSLVAEPALSRVEEPADLAAAPLTVGGRVVATAAAAGTSYRFQWPGISFDAAFTGQRAYVQIGEGNAIYHLIVDGRPIVKLTKPTAGWYELAGLPPGRHTVRVEVASENQGGAAVFGGLWVPRGTKTERPSRSSRQIEFIGDSHTVGYGNTSTTRECSGDGVWLTTDTSQAFGPLTAKHYGADYRIHAISGRGIVRNYNGGGGEPLPKAYPFALFDRQTPADDAGWHPQVIVIGLGTNDFTTPLNPGEKWQTRDELHADYERTYVAFVQQLRARHPQAFFLLTATDMAEGEIQAEVKKVVAQLEASGEKRLAFIAYNQLELTACDWHPSLADHRFMSAAVRSFLDARPEVWQGK